VFDEPGHCLELFVIPAVLKRASRVEAKIEELVDPGAAAYASRGR
jgi:hypothetical protein